MGSEESVEGVSYEGDMLGELWVCEAALRNDERIGLKVVDYQYVIVLYGAVLDQFLVCLMSV